MWYFIHRDSVSLLLSAEYLCVFSESKADSMEVESDAAKPDGAAETQPNTQKAPLKPTCHVSQTLCRSLSVICCANPLNTLRGNGAILPAAHTHAHTPHTYIHACTEQEHLTTSVMWVVCSFPFIINMLRPSIAALLFPMLNPSLFAASQY